jgi:hypothetical protein
MIILLLIFYFCNDQPLCKYAEEAMRRPAPPAAGILKTCGLILSAAVLAFVSAEAAEPAPAPSAAPAEAVPAATGHVNVVELFSSRVCVFCPEAEDYFHTLLQRPGLIGLACPVSYFDADKTSLSQEFCAARQNHYNAALHLGPNYTPQVMVNGVHNVAGNLTDKVEVALKDPPENRPLEIEIKPIQNGSFQLKLPALTGSFKGKLLVALIDRPHRLPARKSGDAPSVYLNIVSALIDAGEWDGTARTLDVKVDLRTENKGFVVLAQNSETMQLAAAGQYLVSAGP